MTNFTPTEIGKFPIDDLKGLREGLVNSGLDSWQAGELISAFLSVRGYGVCTESARHAASRIESAACSIKCMQEEFEKLALVM